VEALGRQQRGPVAGQRDAASTIAESGRIRPGVTSRSAAISSRASHRPGRRPGPAAAHLVQLGGTAPRVDADGGLEAAQVLELLARPLVLAGLGSARRPAPRAARGAPRRRARRTPATARAAAGSTSRRPSAPCFIRKPSMGLDQRGQADARVAEQPPGELGVEQRGRVQADLGEAGEVLGGGVQDPLGAVERLLQRGQRGRTGSGRSARCRRPRGAAGSGRRGPSSGSPTHARRRSRPVRCRRRALGDLDQRLVGLDDRGAARRAASAAGRRARGLLGPLARGPQRGRLRVSGSALPAARQYPEPRWPRRLGIAVTPSGTGGRPAAVHSSSPQASTCGADVEIGRGSTTRGSRSGRCRRRRPSRRSSRSRPG
jgi:hypothetical protein